MSNDNKILEEVTSSDYKYGFESHIETDVAPKERKNNIHI